MAADAHAVPARCRCSLRVATLAVCSFNIVAAIYVLRSFIGPLFSSSSSSSSFLSAGFFTMNARVSSSSVSQYTPEQLGRIMEAFAMWKGAEPLDLINRVREIQEESEKVYDLKEDRSDKKPEAWGLVKRLNEQSEIKSKTDQEALQEWRKKKLEEARRRSEAMKAKQKEYIT